MTPAYENVFRLPGHMVYITLIIGLFAFIYLATLSHWAVIAYLVGIAAILWFVWIKKRKANSD